MAGMAAQASTRGVGEWIFRDTRRTPRHAQYNWDETRIKKMMAMNDMGIENHSRG